MELQPWYTEETIIEFNELSPLANVSFESGYRIITAKVSFDEVLDYLSENYGEGSLIGSAIHGKDWILKPRKESQVLFTILRTKEMLDEFLEHFKLSLTFDNSYAITLKVRKLISPFLLSKITRKNIRKIKQAIAKEFDISAEDIFFNIEKFSIKFKLKDNTITISV